MLSKSQISFVKSLQQKKNRKEYGLFIVEGIKSIVEFVHSDYLIDTIFCTAEALPKLGKLSHKIKLVDATETEIGKLSLLVTPSDALALVQIPLQTAINKENFNNTFTLVFDGVQDPGNLGTIIRTADWFGFKQIVCSADTVDAYNPKVVQATMGSLARVKILYTDLHLILSHTELPVYGAMLHGESVYKTAFKAVGFIVLGNEGNGISTVVQKFITYAVTIPRFGHAESLNVAVSTAIFCSELKRST